MLAQRVATKRGAMQGTTSLQSQSAIDCADPLTARSAARPARSAVHPGAGVDALQAFAQQGVELAVWQRASIPDLL